MTNDLLFVGLAHQVPDLEEAAAAYRALGFPMVGPHAGPTGTGIRTATWRTSRQEYIEAVGVVDQAAATAAYPNQALMDQVRQAGGGGAFHLCVADVPALLDQLTARGVPVAGPVVRSATTATGETVTYTTARVMAGHAWDPFFINFGVPPRAVFARRQAMNLPTSPWTVAHLVVETPEPEGEAAWLADLLGVSVTAADAGAGGQLVAVPGCPLLFTRGVADRIVEVVLDGPAAPTAMVAGLRYRPAARQD